MMNFTKFQIPNDAVIEEDMYYDKRRRLSQIAYQLESYVYPPERKNKVKISKGLSDKFAFYDEKRMFCNFLSFWRKTEKLKKKKANIKFKDIYIRMLQIIESKKLYLEPNFTQQDIVQYLGTNRNYVYIAIKMHCNTNFRGLVNYYRIKHAQFLIQQRVLMGRKYLLSEIYADCGFTTNESFYRTFKKMVGVSPGKYVTRI